MIVLVFYFQCVDQDPHLPFQPLHMLHMRLIDYVIDSPVILSSGLYQLTQNNMCDSWSHVSKLLSNLEGMVGFSFAFLYFPMSSFPVFNNIAAFSVLIVSAITL